MTEIATARFAALGTTAVVLVAAPGALDAARTAVEELVDVVDAACSRFRPDSDLSRVNGRPGHAIHVSPVLIAALDAALDTARATDGLVDPTVGRAVRLLGYDRTFSDVQAQGPALRIGVERIPGWRAVVVDRSANTVLVPRGVELDLGATAKAWCVDRAAEAAHAATGVGVLVSLGGDLATAGPAPEGGWVVLLADRHDAALDGPGPAVVVTEGGLATSGTAARRWHRGDDLVHHIVDPSTGRSAAPCWRTVSVVGPTCLDANVAATAAIVLGPEAPAWLTERGHAARLVRDDTNAVVCVGGWPTDDAGSAP